MISKITITNVSGRPGEDSAAIGIAAYISERIIIRDTNIENINSRDLAAGIFLFSTTGTILRSNISDIISTNQSAVGIFILGPSGPGGVKICNTNVNRVTGAVDTIGIYYLSFDPNENSTGLIKNITVTDITSSVLNEDSLTAGIASVNMKDFVRLDSTVNRVRGRSSDVFESAEIYGFYSRLTNGELTRCFESNIGVLIQPPIT